MIFYDSYLTMSVDKKKKKRCQQLLLSFDIREKCDSINPNSYTSIQWKRAHMRCVISYSQFSNSYTVDIYVWWPFLYSKLQNRPPIWIACHSLIQRKQTTKHFIVTQSTSLVTMAAGVDKIFIKFYVNFVS